MIIVHAGNRADAPGRADPRFPASTVERVTATVDRLLDAFRPSLVISAPASGADLIVLGAAQRREIPLHVIVPLESESFCAESVADGGPTWVRRYHHVLNAAEKSDRDIVEHGDLAATEQWWLAANGWLIDAAAAAGDLTGLPVVALTIRPPAINAEPSVTDDLAHRAGQRGWLVLTIDPRPEGSDVIVAE